MILCPFRDLLSSCPGGKEYRELLTINRKKRRDEKKKSEQFDRVLKCDAVTHPYAREYGTTIFLLKNAKTDINSLLKKAIAEEKKDHN